jgi:hypothetical protein
MPGTGAQIPVGFEAGRGGDGHDDFPTKSNVCEKKQKHYSEISQDAPAQPGKWPLAKQTTHENEH